MKSEITITLPVGHTADYARVLFSHLRPFKLIEPIDLNYGDWHLHVPKGQYCYKLKDILSFFPADEKCTDAYSFMLSVRMEYDDELMSDVPACDGIA